MAVSEVKTCKLKPIEVPCSAMKKGRDKKPKDTKLGRFSEKTIACMGINTTISSCPSMASRSVREIV